MVYMPSALPKFYRSFDSSFYLYIHRSYLLTMTRKTAIVDQATMLARIDEVQEVVAQYSYDQTKILNLLKVEREASKRHTRQLEEVKAKLTAQNEQLESQSQQLEAAKKQLVQQNQTSWSILSVAKDALSGILEVKRMLYDVSRTVVSLHAAIPSTSPGMALDPTMDLPVMIEDSLGRQLPIPAAWIETISWRVGFSLTIVLLLPC